MNSSLQTIDSHEEHEFEGVTLHVFCLIDYKVMFYPNSGSANLSDNWNFCKTDVYDEV